MSQFSSDQAGASAAGRLVESARQTVLEHLGALRGEIVAMLDGRTDDSSATMRVSFEASADGIDAALDELLGVLGRPGGQPSTPGFDARLNAGRCDQIGLAQAYRQLTAALEGLEVGLAPIMARSGDVARVAYARCKQGWDRHLANLATVLNQIGSAAAAHAG